MRKLLSILLPIALIVIFLPQILSLSPFRDIFNRPFSKKFHATTQIEEIHLSWFGPQIFNAISFDSPTMAGHFDALKSASPFWRLNSLGDDFEIKGGQFAFAGSQNSTLVNVSAKVQSHHFEAHGDAVPSGRFNLTGKIFSSNDIDITYDFQKVPTAAIDQFLSGKKLLNQVLGDLVSASGSFVFNQGKGQFSVDLASPNLATKLRAQLDGDFLTLTDPFHAELTLTPDVAAALLSNVNPLFVTAVQGENPIELDINPNGFRFPWRSFDLTKIAIQSATIDMGKITCQSGKALSQVISLFKHFRKSDRTEMWFTPVTFSLNNGVVNAGRMDALISNTIHICTWGNIDLNQSTLNMILGLCADTLSVSFGIQNLPRNYVMKIPLKGTIQNPELDSGPVAGKITALAAAEQLPKVGGKLGQLFGGTINMATRSLDNQDDVPPPKRPFPWE